jgi:small GTP-binding protein
MNENTKLLKKVCMLGDPAVGKTSLIRKYVLNQFDSRYVSTIGTEVSKKDIEVEFVDSEHGKQNYNLTLAIWDIIGQKEYRTLISRFYKNANGALIVFDLTRDDTLSNIKEWTSSLFGAIGKVPVVFVGNKFDLVDKDNFDTDSLMEVSMRYSAPWVTTSAKDGENVDSAFKKLGEMIIQNSLYFERMNSLIDVLDAIIVDFCEVFGGLEVGMPIFKEAFIEIPNANLKEPNKETVEELIKSLTHVTEHKKDKEVADAQFARYSKWLSKVN